MGGFMMRCKGTYKLKQETPLVHFQHREIGATLRATEVKPRLDKFIHEWCKREGIAIPKQWFVDPERREEIPALNYKLRFMANSNFAQATTVPDEKLFLGNMGLKSFEKAEKEIRAVSYTQPIEMSLLSFAEDTVDLADRKGIRAFTGSTQANLLDIAELMLPHFFTIHSFGTRKGKGFGCFSLLPDGFDPRFSAALESFCPGVYYTITYPEDMQPQLDHVWVISNMMKSGFNFTYDGSNNYYKGRIFVYFLQKKPPIGSDKALIKHYILLPDNQDSNPLSEEANAYDEYRYERAMLGLPAFNKGYEYKPGRNSTRKGVVQIKDSESNESKQIGRFASPVRYSIHGNVLYIFADDIPQAMKNRRFTLISDEKSEWLDTPAEKEFNLIDFLDWFAGEFNQRKDMRPWTKAREKPDKPKPVANIVYDFLFSGPGGHPFITKHPSCTATAAATALESAVKGGVG
jgi:hypothetical protein